MQTDPPTRINMTSGEAGREVCGGCLTCTMGAPYTCVVSARVCAMQLRLWFAYSLSTAANGKPSSVNSLSVTVNRALLLLTTATRADRPENIEAKTGKKKTEKQKQTEGTTAVVWYNLENAKQRQVSHTRPHTKAYPNRKVFASLQLLRVARLVSSKLFYHFQQSHCRNNQADIFEYYTLFRKWAESQIKNQYLS